MGPTMRNKLSAAVAILATASLSTTYAAEPVPCVPNLSGHWYIEYWFTASNIPNTHCHAVISLQASSGGEYAGAFATPINPPFDGNTPCGGNKTIDTTYKFTMSARTLPNGGGVFALLEAGGPQAVAFAGFFGVANPTNYWDTAEGSWWGNTNSGGLFSMVRAVPCDYLAKNEPSNQACSANSPEPALPFVRITDTNLHATSKGEGGWVCLPATP